MKLDIQLQTSTGSIVAQFESETIEQYLLDQNVDLAALLPEIATEATPNWGADDLITRLMATRHAIDLQLASQMKADATSTQVVVEQASLSPQDYDDLIQAKQVTHFTQDDRAMMSYERDSTTEAPAPDGSYKELQMLTQFFEGGRNAQCLLQVVSK